MRVWLALACVLALGSAACDNGGLLVAQPAAPDAGGPARTGEIVNGGNQAKNGKYSVVYTVGQPSPNQGVATSPSGRVNGGVVGAMNGQ